MVEGATLGVRGYESVASMLMTAIRSMQRTLRHPSIRRLPACELRAVTVFFERFDNPLAMVALHFDHAVFNCSTRAACGAQLLAQQCKRNGIKRQAFDNRHAFATATLGFSTDPDHTVTYRFCLRDRLAYTFRSRTPAFRTRPAALGGIDETAC